MTPEERDEAKRIYDEAKASKGIPESPEVPQGGVLEAAREIVDRLAVQIPDNPHDAFDVGQDSEELDERWRRIIPARFAAAEVDHLTGSVHEAVTDWRWHPTRNLLLLGQVGVGKTYAACAAARLAHNKRWRVRFWSVVDLMDALRQQNGNAYDVQRQAQDCDLLVLDDLGGEKASDWTSERLYAVVNRRWLDEKPIIATSNLDVKADRTGPLVDAVGRRVFDRLIDGAIVLKVAGKSRRGAA
jgi:hypothetical protein